MGAVAEEYLEEEPNWDDLDWIRPGIRGSVVYRNVRRHAFRASDSSVLFWMKNKWHWATPLTAKRFEYYTIE